LPQAVESADPDRVPPKPLGRSRRLVLTLAALFSLDAFAGGLVVNSLLALWLSRDRHLPRAYTRVSAARIGFTPYQTPHAPLEMGAQSEGATRRAARLTDGVFFGPQVAWRDVARLARLFRSVRADLGVATPGHVGASRSLIVGADKEAAAAAARAYLERTFSMYRAWRMQEFAMVELELSHDAPLDGWTINGLPDDCVEAVARASAMGLERIGFSIYSLPREVDARIEYMQMIAERILKPAGALAVTAAPGS
jgi:alkanesulfonate monooxygenase SsuD/methylene tetrahydromethanopterin reductase-like flavin-dependent oxidoreductase (luciferase family)